MDDPAPKSDPSASPPGGWERIIFLLMALIQVPVGLLTINSERLARLIAEPGRDIHWTSLEIILISTMSVCCVFAGIGLVGGFHQKTIGLIAKGIFVGVILAAVELYVLAFLGCCVSLTHL